MNKNQLKKIKDNIVKSSDSVFDKVDAPAKRKFFLSMKAINCFLIRPRQKEKQLPVLFRRQKMRDLSTLTQ